MKRWCLLAMVLVLTWSAVASASCYYYKNERFHVNVGQANDFFKVFYVAGSSNVVVSSWSSAWGPATDVIQFGPWLIVKWSGPNPVTFCDRVWFCVAMWPVRFVAPVCGVWTLNNTIQGWTGPMWWQWPIWRQADNWLVFNVRNGWKDWVPETPPGLYPPGPNDGPGDYVGPTLATEVYWANLGPGEPLSLPQLTDSLYTAPGINWIPLPDKNLAAQEQGSWDLTDTYGDDDVILVRMVLDNGVLDPADEIFQFRPHRVIEQEADQIPTLSQWGLIILGLLLVTAGALAIIRRRRVEA